MKVIVDLEGTIGRPEVISPNWKLWLPRRRSHWE